MLGAQHTEHETLPAIILLSRATGEGEIIGLSCQQRKANTSFVSITHEVSGRDQEIQHELTPTPHCRTSDTEPAGPQKVSWKSAQIQS